MPSIEVTESTLDRLTRYSEIFGKPIMVVLEESLERAGIGEPKALHTVETAGLYLEVIGFDPVKIVELVADGIILPAVVVGLMEQEAKLKLGRWFPGCGGTEVLCHAPGGRGRYLYCYQPSTRRHAYLSLKEDRFYEDPELTKLLVA